MLKNESKQVEQNMGLERFLQLKPQKRGIMAILRSRYAAEVHTQKDWEVLVTGVLRRQVR